MDKEMQGKVNEFLKEHGMRELNLDDMDKVSGGTGNYEAPEILVAHALIAEQLLEQYDRDIARNYVTQVMKLSDQAADDLITGGAAYMISKMKCYTDL